MSAKKRTAKFVAPKDEAKNDSDDYSSTDSDNDFTFYQSRFPLPTNAPKPAQPSRHSASSSTSNQQPEQWTEVHDTRKEKYQQRRTARDVEHATLAAEAEHNARNEFSSLPRFVPYAKDSKGKWLGGKSQHKVKPKQLGVIEEYIIPDAHNGQSKQKKKSRNELLLTNSSISGGSSVGGSREWSGEADMVDTIVSWIERQLGEEMMTVAQIGERIQARTGDSWNKRYKQHYGPLVDWLRNKQQLIVQGDRVTVRQRQEKQQGEEKSESRERRQQRERRELADRRAEAAAAVRAVSRAERSWLAFVLYVLALLAVVYGAYSVWSGRNMSDLARQLSEQLEAMEEKVTRLHPTAATTVSEHTIK